MPLVPLRPVLDATVKYGYAQGAFNVNAVAQAEAVIAVHEMFRSPAILQGPTWPTPSWAAGWTLQTAPWRTRRRGPQHRRGGEEVCRAKPHPRGAPPGSRQELRLLRGRH